MEHAIEQSQPDAAKILELSNIRSQLIRLEDSIVFFLLGK